MGAHHPVTVLPAIADRLEVALLECSIKGLIRRLDGCYVFFLSVHRTYDGTP